MAWIGRANHALGSTWRARAARPKCSERVFVTGEGACVGGRWAKISARRSHIDACMSDALRHFSHRPRSCSQCVALLCLLWHAKNEPTEDERCKVKLYAVHTDNDNNATWPLAVFALHSIQCAGLLAQWWMQKICHFKCWRPNCYYIFVIFDHFHCTRALSALPRFVTTTPTGERYDEVTAI